MGKVSCEACSKGCKGQAIRLNDKYFHLKCFKCHECKKQLATGGFYTKDNVHYCVEDYQRLHGTKCQICGQYVEGEVVTALGNSYHEQCFHCTSCQKKFTPGDKVTYVGKDYLCNDCLDHSLSITVFDDQGALQLSSSTDDEDIKAKKPKSSMLVPRGGGAGNSMSAPTTPAKQSELRRRIETANLSTPALDISMDAVEVSTAVASPAANTSGYKSATDMSFETCAGVNGSRSHSSLDVPVFTDRTNNDAHYRGRLSPIHNIMRYRSTSPAWSTASRKSKESVDSSGRSSRFDADYGKFYKTSYLEKKTGSDFRRGPSQNLVGSSRDNSPKHYHRPDNFSYSQVRRDMTKPVKKGLLTMLGDREYTNALKRFEPYKPDKGQEPIRLSKIPDAHKHVGYVAPIERDDWPAPPDPAAAYPELLRDRERHVVRRKSTDIVSDHADGVDDKENTIVVNGGYNDVSEQIADVKMEKEIEELSKLKDSGAAKVILDDLKKKKLEKSTLDPRSASRTPSAAMEPPYRPRYESPLFASPSRDTDLRTRLRSCDSLIERKFRTTPLPTLNIHNADWPAHEQPKNLVRNTEVLRPGYTLGVSSAVNMDWRNRFSFEGLNVTEPRRPVSSAGELGRNNVYSSQSSIDEYDPTTGLKKRCRSATMSDGVNSPYLGYRKSVTSVYRVEEPAKVYTCEELRRMVTTSHYAPGVDRETLEHNMAREELEKLFGLSCEQFYRLPEWKRNDLKLKAGLY